MGRRRPGSGWRAPRAIRTQKRLTKSQKLLTPRAVYGIKRVSPVTGAQLKEDEPMFEVRSIEGEKGMQGSLLGTYKTYNAAKRCACKNAYDHYYGTLVYDTQRNRVDYGKKSQSVEWVQL